MSKKVVLVGHCGPDSSYLRMAVASADRSLKVFMADDADELNQMLTDGVDLLLLNRELGWGFEESEGVEVIRQLRSRFPQVKMMLVSNYPEAQAAAVAVGGVPGFGKREIGSPRVAEVIRSALSLATSQSAAS
jgi:two-component system chemotaxis response regulator CheY